MYALFPVLDPLHDTFNPDVTGAGVFTFYLYSSLLMTSYGFGKGAVIILKSTLTEKTESQ